MTQDNEAFAQSRNMRGGCGLVAVANVTGIPLETVFNDYKRLAKKKGRWNGRTVEPMRLKLLERYGVKLIKVKTGQVTLRSFIKDAGHISNANTLIVRTTGHVQIVRHGKVTDQSGTHDIEHFWGKNKIVKSCYRVISVKEYKPLPVPAHDFVDKIITPKPSIVEKRAAKAVTLLERWQSEEKRAIRALLHRDTLQRGFVLMKTTTTAQGD